MLKAKLQEDNKISHHSYADDIQIYLLNNSGAIDPVCQLSKKIYKRVLLNFFQLIKDKLRWL